MDPTKLETRRFKGFTVTEVTKQSNLVTTELTAEPNVHIPKHHHPKRQKAYYVLSGLCEVFAGGHLILLNVGGSLEIPAGMVHAISIHGEGVCLLVAFTEPNDETIWEGEKPERIN